MENKKLENSLGIVLGTFDIINKNFVDSISESCKNHKCIGAGVYSNELIEQIYRKKLLKSLEDRMEIAKQIKGIDFVYPVYTMDPNIVKQAYLDAYDAYMHQAKEMSDDNAYSVGILIGTYDLFHYGHLENILLAKKQCDKLIAVVKTDSRVYKSKKVRPFQDTTERSRSLSMIKLIDDIVLMDKDTTRTELIEKVCKEFNCKKKEIAVILGSDLIKKEAKYTDEWEGVNVMFTPRPENYENDRSSTFYRKKAETEEILEL